LNIIKWVQNIHEWDFYISLLEHMITWWWCWQALNMKMTHWIIITNNTSFFLRGVIFTFLKPEKYDFNIEKGFLYSKKPLIYKIKKKIANFLQHVQVGSKNIKGFLNFLLSYLVYNQIWLYFLLMISSLARSQNWGAKKFKFKFKKTNKTKIYH